MESPHCKSPHCKFVVHKSFESGDISFSIYLVTTISKCHVTLWMGPLILSDHPAKFRVHRLYGTGNNGVCNISSNSSSISNSNPNAEVPMPRFTNGCYFAKAIFKEMSLL